MHHFSDNTNEGALDYQKLVNKKLIDSFTNYPVTVVSDTYHSIGNKSTCSINKMSERLVENSVVVFIGISANRSNDLDFIAKTLSLIYDRNITFMWICNWVNNELPLTLIKDSYKSCYVRISPLFGHGSTDIDREFSSIYGENNYDRDIQDLMGLAIMQYQFATCVTSTYTLSQIITTNFTADMYQPSPPSSPCSAIELMP